MASIRLRLRTVAFFSCVAWAKGQTNLEQSGKSLDGLLNQVQELRVALEEMRGQVAGARRES